MTTSAEVSGPAVTIKQQVTAEVRAAAFELLATVEHLDLAELGRAKHAEIEVGYFTGSCCRRFVRATVEKGMVTALAVEPCSDGEMEGPPSAELQRLFKAAATKLNLGGRRKTPFPMPVADFMGQAAALTIRSIWCIEICIWGFCFVCCTTYIPDLPIFCGRTVIIHSPVSSP